MKRSEMVDLMVKTERECQEYKCGRAFMQTILKKMEEAGMLPPYRQDGKGSPMGYGAGWLDEEEIYEQKFYWQHQWEEEDEK